MSDKISALRSLKDPVDWPSLLRSALTGEGVASAYQPIVDITRATVVGYEALARFPGYPISDPERWFDAADRHGCGAALQAVALRCALAERTALPPNCFLSVNIGPEVLSSPKVREVWGDVGDMSGVIVELTEHARIDSYGELQADFARLRAAGALLAVDDVGSGYAGLTHLLALRPEMIKLDRALIDGIDRDEAKRGLVEMIGTFAARMDGWILAEGIERAEELSVIAELGVPLAQGYYLGRPAPQWTSLNAQAERTLVECATMRSADTLRGRLEHPPVVTDRNGIAAAFSVDGVDLVVLQDNHDRPLAVITERDAPDNAAATALKVNVDTPLADAALRAITRSPAEWATPLLCTDNAGRYVGIVRIQRILHALATRSTN